MRSLIVMLALMPALASAMSWNNRGANRYTGTIDAALTNYAKLPAGEGFTPGEIATLRKRMAKRDYDEIATIERDRIVSQKWQFTGELKHMHFGTGKVAATVDRSGWPAGDQERALLYCLPSNDRCIVVPTVCTNVAIAPRIAARRALPDPVAPPQAAGGGGLRYPEQFQWQPMPLPELSLTPPSVAFEPYEPPPLVVQPEPDMQPWFGPRTFPLLAPPALPAIPAPVPAIPEPSTWALLALGLGLVSIQRRRMNRG